MNNKQLKIKWTFKVKEKILKKYLMIITTLKNNQVIYQQNLKTQSQKIKAQNKKNLFMDIILKLIKVRNYKY